MAKPSKHELDPWMRRSQEAGNVFTPSHPVQIAELFIGRVAQLETLIDALTTRGQHIAIFGEPGVGKTSLARFTARTLSERSVYITCTKDASLTRLFEAAFAQIKVRTSTPVTGFAPDKRVVATPLRDLIGKPPWTSMQLQDALSMVSAQDTHIVFFDEFDRLAAATKATFAELLKALSDRNANLSIVIIGVAHDIEGLVAEHSSVDRCLRQIRMPRMSDADIEGILTRGLDQLGMSATPAARSLLTKLSRGLPYFAHTLALGATRNAIRRGEDQVRLSDMRTAVTLTIREKESTMGTAYQKALGTVHSDRFRQVLAACVFCDKDLHGNFAVNSVRNAYAPDVNAPDSLPSSMSALTKPTHGAILESHGIRQSKTFRFRNPLVEAYIGLVESSAEWHEADARALHSTVTSGVDS